VNYAPSKKKAAFMFDYIGPDAIIPRDRVEEVRGHCLLHTLAPFEGETLHCSALGIPGCGCVCIFIFFDDTDLKNNNTYPHNLSKNG
jgi:hypothetical protein